MPIHGIASLDSPALFDQYMGKILKMKTPKEAANAKARGSEAIIQRMYPLFNTNGYC